MEEKQIIIIFGENGCGKTELAKKIVAGKTCVVTIGGQSWHDDIKQNPVCEWLVVEDAVQSPALIELFSANKLTVRKQYEAKPVEVDCPNVLVVSNDVTNWRNVATQFQEDMESGKARPVPGKSVQFIMMSKRF